jgi:hypothetical protein
MSRSFRPHCPRGLGPSAAFGMPSPDNPRQLHYFFMSFKRNTLKIKGDL